MGPTALHTPPTQTRRLDGAGASAEPAAASDAHAVLTGPPCPSSQQQACAALRRCDTPTASGPATGAADIRGGGGGGAAAILGCRAQRSDGAAGSRLHAHYNYDDVDDYDWDCSTPTGGSRDWGAASSRRAGGDLHLEPPCAFPTGSCEPRYQLLRRLGQASAACLPPVGPHRGALACRSKHGCPHVVVLCASWAHAACVLHAACAWLSRPQASEACTTPLATLIHASVRAFRAGFLRQRVRGSGQADRLECEPCLPRGVLPQPQWPVPHGVLPQNRDPAGSSFH